MSQQSQSSAPLQLKRSASSNSISSGDESLLSVESIDDDEEDTSYLYTRLRESSDSESEDIVVEERTNVLDIDLNQFNLLCLNEKKENGMDAFACMNLNGTTLDSSEDVKFSVNPRVDIHDSENIVTGTDIDMFGVMSDHIPCARTFSLNVLPSIYDSFTSRVCTLFEGEPINTIPNMLIGRYGDSNRIQLYIFFPRFKGDLTQEELTFFMDTVLIPAMQFAAKNVSNDEHLIPLSTSNEKFHKRRVGGTFLRSGTFINAQYLDQFVMKMAEIINERKNIEEKYAYFGDFFFYSHAYGTKTIFRTVDLENEDGFDRAFEEAIGDIEWNGIDKSIQVVFDLAVKITKLPKNGQEFTGLWVAANKDRDSQWFGDYRDIRCKLLMDGGFLDVDAVPNSRYRHDIFATLRSIGGFRYYPIESKMKTMDETGGSGGQAPYHFLSMQAYHTIKSPFYVPRKRGFRRTRDISMEDLVVDPDSGFKLMASCDGFLDTCHEMRDKRYPLRYELSFRYVNGRRFVLNNLDNVNDRIINGTEHEPFFVFYPTDTIVQHYINRIEAQMHICKSLVYAESHHARRESPQTLTIYSAFCVLFNSLVSAPHPLFRAAFSFMNRLAMRDSSLMLYQDLFVFEDDTWSVSRIFPGAENCFNPNSKKREKISEYEQEAMQEDSRAQSYAVEQLVFRGVNCLHPANYLNLHFQSVKSAVSLIENNRLSLVLSKRLHIVYNSLSYYTKNIVNMLLIEGINTTAVISLINLFCQDVWKHFKQPESIIKQTIDTNNDVRMEDWINFEKMNNFFIRGAHFVNPYSDTKRLEIFHRIFPTMEDLPTADDWVALIQHQAATIPSRTAFLFVMAYLIESGNNVRAVEFQRRIRNIYSNNLSFFPHFTNVKLLAWAVHTDGKRKFYQTYKKHQ